MAFIYPESSGTLFGYKSEADRSQKPVFKPTFLIKIILFGPSGIRAQDPQLSSLVFYHHAAEVLIFIRLYFLI